MKYFGVFGNPILHSKSPQMFNNVFKKEGIDGYYTRIWARTGEEVVKLIRELNLTGANITSPFKETVIPHLDHLSTDAKNIEAVNTITLQNGKLTGHNTDPFGVTGAIQETGINLHGKKCIVFGAGGAGKAAAYGLIKAGADVTITNRTIDKARKVSIRFSCNYIDYNDAANNINDYDIIVMALLPGVWPIDNNELKPGMVILNSVYSGTKREDETEKVNYYTIDGLRWLLHHAVECSKLFTGKKAQLKDIEEGIKHYLDKDSVNIYTINEDVFELLASKKVDFLLPAGDLDENQLNRVIEQEKKHAFS